MKTFKDMWEDAAANSVSGGGVSLPADAVKKKKINLMVQAMDDYLNKNNIDRTR